MLDDMERRQGMFGGVSSVRIYGARKFALIVALSAALLSHPAPAQTQPLKSAVFVKVVPSANPTLLPSAGIAANYRDDGATLKANRPAGLQLAPVQAGGPKVPTGPIAGPSLLDELKNIGRGILRKTAEVVLK